jgi:hypothetical protein
MIVAEDTIKLLLGIGDEITPEEQAFLTLIHPWAEGAVKNYLHYDPEQRVHTQLYPRNVRSGGPGHTNDSGVFGISGNMAYWQSIRGERTLQLDHIPLRSVTTVHVDTDAKHGTETNSFVDADLYTNGDDYWADWEQTNVCNSGQLHAYGSWPSDPGTVQVVYRAGYSVAEFAGNVTADVTADDGTITTAGVDASGVAMAVQTTVVARFLRAMSLKKKSRIGFTSAPLLSERAQDYSYTVDKSGLGGGDVAGGLSDDAKERLQPFVHYGVARL